MRRKATPRRRLGEPDEPGDPATADLVLGYAVGPGGHGNIAMLAALIVALKRFGRWLRRIL